DRCLALQEVAVRQPDVDALETETAQPCLDHFLEFAAPRERRDARLSLAFDLATGLCHGLGSLDPTGRLLAASLSERAIDNRLRLSRRLQCSGAEGTKSEPAIPGECRAKGVGDRARRRSQQQIRLQRAR